MNTHSLQCRCGKLTGQVTVPRKGSRGVCYCKDCQAYAHFLGAADIVLDDMGGTDVVATLPKHLRITGGMDALACLSLTDRGILRSGANAGAHEERQGTPERDALEPGGGTRAVHPDGRSGEAGRQLQDDPVLHRRWRSGRSAQGSHECGARCGEASHVTNRAKFLL